MMDAQQIELFGEAVKPTNFRDECDDRYDSALLDGCPRGFLSLVSGKGVSLPIADQYDALKDLMRDMNIREIAKMTGIHKTRLEGLLPFGQLPSSLQVAIRDERIKTGVARKLLRLSQGERVRALEIFEREGKLTAQDLGELRRVTVQNATSSFPESLFAPGHNGNGNGNGNGHRGGDDMSLLIRQMAKQYSPDEIRDAFENAMEQVFEEV